MPGDGDPVPDARRARGRDAAARIARTSATSASHARRGRRVAVQVALGLAHDAGLGRDVEAHLVTRSRSTSSVEPPPMSITSVGVRRPGRARWWRQEGEPRLLVAGEHVGLEAVAVAHLLGELARRWRRRARRWSAPRPRRRRRARRSRPGSSSSTANTRCIASSPRRPSASTPAPEAGDHRAPAELVGDAAVLDVGDQQPRRVGCRCRRRRRSCRAQPSRGRSAGGTGCGIGRPSSAASRLSTARSAIASRAVCVAEPMCGTTIRFGALSSGSSAASGSGSVTSSAAPAISPSRSASSSAAWSTIGPRAVLMRIAVGLHRAPARRRRSGGGSRA